jgi:phosphoglycerate-specific signal transduction histidine kinase
MQLSWLPFLNTSDSKETATEVRERLALAAQVATGAQLSPAIAHEIVQPLSALVANARAALHWLEGDPKDIPRAASLIEIVLRDGMSIGNVVHKMRKLFEAQALKRRSFSPTNSSAKSHLSQEETFKERASNSP